MKARNVLLGVICLTVTAVRCGKAEAAYILFDDRSQFQAATGPLVTEGFNAQHAAGNPVDFGPFTVASGRGTVNWTNSNNPNTDLAALVSEGDGAIWTVGDGVPGIQGGLLFEFDLPIRVFGMDITDNDSGLTVDSSGAGLNETLAAPGTAAPVFFFGIISDTPFIRINLRWPTNGEAVGADFLQYAQNVPERFEADFDEDSDVDGDDFLAWQGGFGTQTGAQKSNGDYDNDGDVDGDDFLGWQSQFGLGSGSASAAVPEPSSIVLLIAALVVAVFVKRWH